MNEHTLRIVEYREALAQLEPFAHTCYGLERIARLQPTADPDWIERELDFVWQAREFLERADLTFGGIREIRPQIGKAEKDFLLTPQEFLDIFDLTHAAMRIRTALLGAGRGRREQDVEHRAVGHVREAAADISDLSALGDESRSKVSDSGEVPDSASPQLAKIRTQIRTRQARLQDRLNSIITSATYREALQDPLIVTRGGRYCVPVKSEHKGKIKGIVHDRSQSGATLFIEPAAVVEHGNKLAELAIEERDEVERILRELGRTVASYADELRRAVDAIGRLDWAFARARYSFERKAARPRINRGGVVRLVDACHPLLTGEVVPIDLEVGEGARCLVITGPNTGGKTVTLKTVGLLTLLMQSGVPVTASDETELCVFRAVYADIGDEQSIQQSLSTFSSHITNIARIMADVDDRTLVLLDELGAGTDPAEGAALGKSLLINLMDAGATTLATTHYGELKEFAITHPGIENAGVEFDVVTLRPTFKIRMGIPGESNAITIADRLGLPKPVIEEARRQFGAPRESVEGVIVQLKRDREESAEGLRGISERLRALEARERELEDELKRTKEASRRSLVGAQERASQILSQAESAVEDAIREMRKDRTTESATRARGVLRDARRRLSESIAAEREGEGPREPLSLVPGDLVQVGTGGPVGRVLDVDEDQKTALVAMSGKRVSVEIGRLVRCEDTEVAKKSRRSGSMEMQKTLSTPFELNVRGMRYDEAEFELERYLDDVVLAGYEKVRIVHGKGTGALRRLVAEVARKHGGVKSSQLCPPEQGGDGATEIIMRD
jgi:DNA mismatch repair protein MutS2